MIKPDPSLPLESQSDETLARLCIWGEARGEGPIGMLAVRYVISNRTHKTGKTTGQVVLQPLQFSSFNKNDPNREHMLQAPMLDPKGWAVIDAVCELFHSVLTVDPTHEATHYYVPKQVQPVWGVGHPKWVTTAEIGAHLFGKAG